MKPIACLQLHAAGKRDTLVNVCYRNAKYAIISWGGSEQDQNCGSIHFRLSRVPRAVQCIEGCKREILMELLAIRLRETEITKVPFVSLVRRVDKRSASTIIGYRWMRCAYPPYN